MPSHNLALVARQFNSLLDDELFPLIHFLNILLADNFDPPNVTNMMIITHVPVMSHDMQNLGQNVMYQGKLQMI